MGPTISGIEMNTPTTPLSRKRFSWSLRTFLLVAALIPLIMYGVYTGLEVRRLNKELNAARNGAMTCVYTWEAPCQASIQVRDRDAKVPFCGHRAGMQHQERLREFRREMLNCADLVLEEVPGEYRRNNVAVIDKYQAEGTAWLSKH